MVQKIKGEPKVNADILSLHHKLDASIGLLLYEDMTLSFTRFLHTAEILCPSLSFSRSRM